MTLGEKGKKKDKKKEKSLLERLPKLSRTSQTILILALLIAVFLPTYLIYYQQPRARAGLESSRISLQKILEVELTPKARLEADLIKTRDETVAARAAYPNPNQVPELVNHLIGLAKQNDVKVTETQVSISKLPAPRESGKDKTTPAERIDTIVSIRLGLKGQVSHFQNFLLALDSQFPTARIKQVNFAISSEEGEEDTGGLSLDIMCYQGESAK